MKPAVDNRRTAKATNFDWKAADYPEYGEPGACQLFTKDQLIMACPGCGKFAPIRVGYSKPADSPSWAVVSGTLEDAQSLTLSPSINCIGCCGWHGWLKNGVFAV